MRDILPSRLGDSPRQHLHRQVQLHHPPTKRGRPHRQVDPGQDVRGRAEEHREGHGRRGRGLGGRGLRGEGVDHQAAGGAVHHLRATHEHGRGQLQRGGIHRTPGASRPQERVETPVDILIGCFLSFLFYQFLEYMYQLYGHLKKFRGSKTDLTEHFKLSRYGDFSSNVSSV